MKKTATPKNLRGYLQGISGLFISPTNPGGLTPKEIDILTAFVFLLKSGDTKQVTTDIKATVANMFNYPPQVVTNYVKKLRDKKVLTLTNELHPLLYASEITIKYTETKESENNLQSGSVQRGS
jgi:hypothetical protein